MNIFFCHNYMTSCLRNVHIKFWSPSIRIKILVSLQLTTIITWWPPTHPPTHSQLNFSASSRIRTITNYHVCFLGSCQCLAWSLPQFLLFQPFCMFNSETWAKFCISAPFFFELLKGYQSKQVSRQKTEMNIFSLHNSIT